MSAPAEPLRLLLLADTPDWAPLLGERLRALGPAFSLSIVTTWEGAATLFAAEPRGLLLATPACLPLGTPCPWPVILLLQQEPAQAPVGVVDWLAAEQLSEDSLRRCLRYARERLGLQATLQLLAEQDPLTGIANRQGFQTLLAARLSEFDGRGLVLGHLDLDNFRHVNDSLGHQGGDRLILQVVNRLRGFMENGDSLARLGSDEFALLLDTRRDPQRAERVAERIVECLGEPYWIDGESLLLGCSLGLAHARADEGADPLMWHAHIAMQQAKSRQGCTFHVFDERINRGVRSLADLEAELRRALRRDELELHYQPILALADGEVHQLEALVRWRHPTQGLLGPDRFIGLAEANGMIDQLDDWVLRRACRDLRSLHLAGHERLRVAVNCCASNLGRASLVDEVRHALEQAGLAACFLELEVTEDALMYNIDQTIPLLERLRELGVSLSIDDFGTGYSSLAYLRRLPLDALKVDRSFIMDIPASQRDMEIAQAIIAMAQKLHLKVVAEGVETPQQLAFLRENHCELVQGYLFSRPLPLAALEEFLRAYRFDAAPPLRSLNQA